MLTLDTINQCKAAFTSSISEYNESFLGRFINATREDSGIGGAYASKIAEIADTFEAHRAKTNERFDDIISSLNACGRTVEGFVEANLTGNLLNKVQDATSSITEVEVVRERTTETAPGL